MALCSSCEKLSQSSAVSSVYTIAQFFDLQVEVVVVVVPKCCHLWDVGFAGFESLDFGGYFFLRFHIFDVA